MTKNRTFVFNLTTTTGAKIRAELFADNRATAMQTLINWQMPIQWLLTSDETKAIDRIKEFYQFFGTSTLMTGGIVGFDGVYEYPQDPPLYPRAKLTLDSGEYVYLYPYDMLASVDSATGLQSVMRVD